jgi:mono/diheme cytochrome c family protein
MRATSLAAGGLACAGAALTIAALAGGAARESPPAAARHSGLDVWLQQGCGSCHTFKPAGSTGPIGPDLQVTLRGRSRDYVLESIVLPSNAFAPGFSGGMMPEDYARRIAPQDLEPLVDFLLRGAQQAGA